MANNTNDFVAFATGTGANVETPAQWSAETVVQQGFQAGICPSIKMNTVLRQASSIAAMVAEFMATYGTSNVQDNGDISTLMEQFVTALSLLVSETLPTQVLYNAVDTGTTDAAVVTSTSPTLSNPSKWDVFVIQKCSAANDGPMTLKLISTTAALEWQDGSVLAAGDWPANSLAVIIYDGSVFRYMGAVGPTVFARTGQLPPAQSVIHVGSGVGVDAITATTTPSFSSLVDGTIVELTPNSANATNASTLNANSLGAVTIVRNDETAIQPGDLQPGRKTLLAFNSATNHWQILGLITSNLPTSNEIIFSTPGTTNWTVPAGITRLKKVRGWGGGGSGGGAVNGGAPGGAGGGYFELVNVLVTPGQIIPITVGPGGAASTGNGATGGTTSFGTYASASGGTGGLGANGNYPSTHSTGGTAAGGNMNLQGYAGGLALQMSAGGIAGPAGGSPFGGSNGTVNGDNAQPGSGGFPGGGGNGAVSTSSSPILGAIGMGGLIIVEY